MDEKGNVYLVDPKKDIIVTGALRPGSEDRANQAIR